MPTFRTDEEIMALCEEELRRKDAVLAKDNKCLSEDYKRAFRSSFLDSYHETFASNFAQVDGQHRFR